MARQKGFTLLLGLLVLLVAGATVFLGTERSASDQRMERLTVEPRVLAAAREALAAYALAGGSNGDPDGRPGSLPCPDMNNDGVASNVQCQSQAVYVGRLPRATLDIDPDLVRASSEIWYALDDDFVNWTGTILNTGAAADLQVDGTSGFAAAIIRAGDPVAGQGGRPSVDRSDYLEGENDDGDKVFASCATDACNDRVFGVTPADLLALVRTRLLGEIRGALEAFHAGHGYYPWAAPLGDADGACKQGTLAGSLPVAAGDCGTDYLSKVVADGGPLPDWIADNDWQQYVYYAVATPCSPPSGSGCTSGAAGLLSLDGDGDRAVVLATSGAPIVSAAKGSQQDRSGPVPRDVLEYLDSAENTDGDDVYDDPDNGTGENDRLDALAAP